MAVIPEDFKELLPKTSAERDDRPHIVLWVFNPTTGHTHTDWSEKHDHAHYPHHHTMVDETVLHHPEHVRGYAIAIKDGWRVMTHEQKPVEDPYKKKSIQLALRQSFPLDLPKVLPHGDPLKHRR